MRKESSADFRIHATSDDTIHVEIGGNLTLPPGGLTIVPPLPDGKRIMSLKCECEGSATIGAEGNHIEVFSLPLVAVLAV